MSDSLDSDEPGIPLPEYAQNRTIKVAGREMPCEQLLFKVFAWEVSDPSQFKITDKTAAKNLAASASFLTEHPELAEKLGISAETLETLVRLK